MPSTSKYKNRFLVTDYFTQNFLLSTSSMNDFWQNQLNISKSMTQLYQKVIEDSYKDYLSKTDLGKLNQYLQDLMKLLGKGFYLPTSPNKLSDSDREKLLADFVLIVHDCFKETATNYFMYSSDSVLLPIYEKYKEQVSQLKKRVSK